MTLSASTAEIPQRRFVNGIDEVSAQRVADAAAETTKRHLAQFTHLAALAKSVQGYVPAGTTERARQCAELARTLLAYAEQFERSANVDDIMFSVIATGNRRLFDKDVRNAVLLGAIRRRPQAAT